MSIECCGRNRDTPFCPTCGQALIAKNHSAVGLLTYIRNSLRTHQTKVRIVSLRLEKCRAGDSGYDRSQLERELRNAQKTTAKWEAWKRILVDLIENDMENDDGTT